MGNIGPIGWRGRYDGPEAEKALDDAFAKQDAAALKAAMESDPNAPGVHVDKKGRVSVVEGAGRKGAAGALVVGGALVAPEVIFDDDE